MEMKMVPDTSPTVGVGLYCSVLNTVNSKIYVVQKINKTKLVEKTTNNAT